MIAWRLSSRNGTIVVVDQEWIDDRKLQLLAQIDALPQNQYFFEDGEVVSPRGMTDIIEMDYYMGYGRDNSDLPPLFRTTVNTSMQFPLFHGIENRTPYDSIQYDESFLRKLDQMSNRKIANKTDNRLIVTASVLENENGEQRIRRRDIAACLGVWWDMDGNADLTVDEFIRIFPEIEMYMYATSRSTPDEPRWRAFMPTDFAMAGLHNGDDPRQPADSYWVVMRSLVARLNQHGFWSGKEIENGKKGKRHGMDNKVWRPEVKIYLPSIPIDPTAAMSLIVTGSDRAPIRLESWIETQVDAVLAVEPRPPSEPPVVERMADILRGRQASKHGSKPHSALGRQIAVEKAINRWRATFKGQGNLEFWRLACTLAGLGLSETEVEAKLNDEAYTSHSTGSERMAEIPGIIANLRAKGPFS